MSISKATSVRFNDEDLKAIEAIKQRYGITTDSDAHRFALRIVAESDVQLTARHKKKMPGSETACQC